MASLSAIPIETDCRAGRLIGVLVAVALGELEGDSAAELLGAEAALETDAVPPEPFDVGLFDAEPDDEALADADGEAPAELLDTDGEVPSAEDAPAVPPVPSWAPAATGELTDTSRSAWSPWLISTIRSGASEPLA